MQRYIVYGMIIAVVMALAVMPAFSQENKPAKEENALTPAPTPSSAPETVKTGELSLYGEVQAVSASASSMSVQYYDYDNDEEKTVEITVDKDTKLENFKTIDGVKKGDWVDINYASVGGKNIAKMVSVEKEEPAAEEAASAAAE